MKQIIIGLMILFALASLVSAATVNLDPQRILANQSYQTSSTVTPNFNVTGNSSTWSCTFYGNTNGSSGVGSWRALQTDSGVTNNTNINLSQLTSLAEISGLKYSWDVFCNSSDDSVGDWGDSANTTAAGLFNFSVDTTAPSVTLNSPANRAWFTAGTGVIVNLTVVDNNAAQCVLDTNLNASTNNTGSYVIDSSTVTYTNNTAFNFSNINGLQNWADNGTSAYLWTYRCNDSAGQNTVLGSNYTFFVDSVAPTAFIFDTSLWKTDNRLLFNATNATDYTPQVGWNQSTDLNFSRYQTCYYNDSYSDTSPDCINVTNTSTLSVNITILSADENYFILVTAFDLAGNQRNMSVLDYKYSTTSTNRLLKAGWNIIGNIGNAFNLSSLLSWSGATTVSIWNSTHQFQSHVSGGSNGAVSITSGSTALVYVSADTNFSDMIQNATAVSTLIDNVTNQTASDWNLVMNRNHTVDFTLQSIDKYLNTAGNSVPQNNTYANVTLMSYYNNSATVGSKSIPFVGNWSINNGTTIKFGQPIWMYFAAGVKNQTVNWGAIS